MLRGETIILLQMELLKYEAPSLIEAISLNVEFNLIDEVFKDLKEF
jgi:hypothetical protein